MRQQSQYGPPEFLSAQYSKAILKLCRVSMWNFIWMVTDIVTLTTGVVTNVALLWLLLRERKSLSASKVLGVSLAVMDLVYVSVYPAGLIVDAMSKKSVKLNNSGPANDTADPLEKARDIFSMYNMIGCPLLLTCMCIERYMAVMRPILYLRVRRWEYGMAVSAVVCAITFFFIVAIAIQDDITVIVLSASFIISILFLIMLACLMAVVWSLRQQSPAHTTHGNQRRPDSPQKKQAVVNVLVVVVPAVISYLPVLVMFPMVLYFYYHYKTLDSIMCNIFQTCLLFPRCGVFIGPLFFFSRARQMWCFSGAKKK